MSFFKSFFNPSASSFPQDGSEGDDDWEAGDIAECISSGKWYEASRGTTMHPGPVQGQRLKVVDVSLRDVPGLGAKLVALSFSQWPDLVFAAECFRKVRPQADEEIACDAEFADLIKRAPLTLPPPSRELEEAA